MAAVEVGEEFTIHCRRPGIQAMGVSRGRARFLCGGGISVFVVREEGLLPKGTECRGIIIPDGMVATIGVAIPYSDDHSLTYHLIPKEWLADPEYPGLPPGLSPMEIEHWLAPPPEFEIGGPSEELPGYFLAIVQHDISDKEVKEGGGTIAKLTVRGRSYLPLNGLPLH
jgi:hypothetical protein